MDACLRMTETSAKVAIPTRRVASVAALLLACAGVAAAQTNTPLWGTVTFDWLKTDGVRFHVTTRGLPSGPRKRQRKSADSLARALGSPTGPVDMSADHRWGRLLIEPERSADQRLGPRRRFWQIMKGRP
jgi:hypothetical protein